MLHVEVSRASCIVMLPLHSLSHESGCRRLRSSRRDDFSARSFRPADVSIDIYQVRTGVLIAGSWQHRREMFCWVRF